MSACSWRSARRCASRRCTPPSRPALTSTSPRRRSKNGLRVQLVEDHAAPVDRAQHRLRRRLAQRAQGTHGLRASVRAHDVQGLAERRRRRAFLSGVLQRRLDERHDQRRPHAVLRVAAGEPARAGAVPGSRSHALARRSRRRSSTTSARRSRKSGACASTTSPTAGPYERFGELFYDNFAYKHSTIGSMEDLNAASLEDVGAVLPHVLRAEQRGAEPGRRLSHAMTRCA